MVQRPARPRLVNAAISMTTSTDAMAVRHHCRRFTSVSRALLRTPFTASACDTMMWSFASPTRLMSEYTASLRMLDVSLEYTVCARTTTPARAREHHM
jgi:hypothetical protein